ncbi:hypothetical protein CGLO_02556 [Colletotrichum gloeosporioides Cg-14]|uniref:Prefoldin subunit n=1 Tax=Colletotrichum gloeosporioides (strain Cg-14) TaxID=1237896 RepID=T0M0P3_COLGC|nr:hypothetical protein CGLO_02556 [Colletotrichum gloeosporioides Cg-14]
MSAPAASQRKQQDLQTQYGIYKNTLQQIAQKIGDVEQEAEEHKCVFSYSFRSPAVSLRWFPLGVLHDGRIAGQGNYVVRGCHELSLKPGSWSPRTPLLIKTPLESNMASTHITPLVTSWDRYERKMGRRIMLTGDKNRLVLETLQPLSGDRKAFRLINGVLMEQTVKDVLPALTTNSEGLKKVLEDLVKQYKTKQDELEKWKKKNNVQVVQN